MPKEPLFAELCQPSILRVGWYLAQGDSRDDFATDPFGYEDYAFMLEDRISYLIEQLRDHRYRPQHLVKIDIPKSDLTVRPGAVLPIEESVLLHAIMFLIATRFDSALFDNVYSYRLHPNWKKRVHKARTIFREGDAEKIPFLKAKTIRQLDPHESWYTAWADFESESSKAVHMKGYTHLATTDIAAYFENIDIRLLEKRLEERLKNEPTIVALISTLLRNWTSRTDSGVTIERGIPQGNDVSSFLGNIYLMPVDRALADFCKRHDAVWWRYVDDIRLFTKSYEDAREGVFLINNELRKLHLNIQGSKTQIFSGTSLISELDDHGMSTIEEVWENLQKIFRSKKPNSKKITNELRKLAGLTKRYSRELNTLAERLNKHESRVFRRLMTIYGHANRPQLQKAALQALRHIPDRRMTQKTLQYLKRLPYSRHQTIVDELLKLLESDDLRFPYQAAEILQTIRFLHPEQSNNLATRIRQIALRSNRDWYVKQKGIETIASLPYRPDHALILGKRSVQDSNSWVRRAACMLIVRAEASKAKHELKKLADNPDPTVSRVARYWCHYLEDSEFALGSVKKFEKSPVTDDSFLFKLSTYYLLRCSEDEQVNRALAVHLRRHKKTKSLKIIWHVNNLLTLMEPIIGPHEQLGLEL